MTSPPPRNLFFPLLFGIYPISPFELPSPPLFAFPRPAFFRLSLLPDVRNRKFFSFPFLLNPEVPLGMPFFFLDLCLLMDSHHFSINIFPPPFHSPFYRRTRLCLSSFADAPKPSSATQELPEPSLTPCSLYDCSTSASFDQWAFRPPRYPSNPGLKETPFFLIARLFAAVFFSAPPFGVLVFPSNDSVVGVPKQNPPRAGAPFAPFFFFFQFFSPRSPQSLWHSGPKSDTIGGRPLLSPAAFSSGNFFS